LTWVLHHVWGQIDWFSRYENNRRNLWFIVRYSNGAVHPDEVDHWTIKRIHTEIEFIKYWLIRENKNAENG
jgi:hypothetical protein